MNLKETLKVSTSLMLVYASLTYSSTKAEDYVTKTQVNAVNGVAGLSGNKQVTADVNNNNIVTSQVKISTQYKSANGSVIERPLIKMVPDNSSMFTLGKEMVQIGGKQTKCTDGSFCYW